MRTILTHLAALYIGAGLFGALTLASFLPLNAFGVAYYTVTWPEHIYCARETNECAPMITNWPPQLQAMFFKRDLGQ